MSSKIEFVKKALRPEARMSVLCREYGISRETGYKWLNRYKAEGAGGLEERSRRPKSVPFATAEDVVAAVLELREKHPRRGPRKLFGILNRQLGEQTPSIATIARILRRFGLVRQRSKFRRHSIVEVAPKIPVAACNDVWTVDYKGWWRTRDGARCEPLTVRDAFCRKILAIRVMKTPSMDGARKVFEELFRRYGVPRHIQCDNGLPFIYTGSRGGLTRLSAWWVSLDVVVVRSRPGCPQDNGGHERMHRDMAEELQKYPAGSLIAEQRACDLWRQEFNHVRPHDALGGKVPADVYRRSERKAKVTRYQYPLTWVVRTVTDNGAVNMRHAQFQAGKALARQQVALEPLGGLTYRLWFRHVDLGTVELPVTNHLVDTVAEELLARTKPTGLARRKRAA